MYGTIARLHPAEGRKREIEALMDGWRRDRGNAPGLVASYLQWPDDDPEGRPTVFLIAIFEDVQSYRANADDPAQDEWYRKLRAALEDDPEWTDGTFTGGSRA